MIRSRSFPAFEKLMERTDLTSWVAMVLLSVALAPSESLHASSPKPNILWLSAEDHGPHLGCYGDAYAVTPNVDAFARRSLRYKNAVSTAPVCAPARTTIISGMYATSLGAHHMRSQVRRPSWHRLFTEYLRDAGYYCTNNRKTDYNLEWKIEQVWDESSAEAHYKNRRIGQPFFAVFNQGITHESRIRDENPRPQHDPASVTLPPYHPDTPEVRKDWAQYYDRLTQMDTWFGEQLEALEAASVADSTIVFFWADHGSGMPRGKRYAGWSGIHVPLIVHIPEQFKHLRPRDYHDGGSTTRLVGFVDFAPTVLSLAGIKPREFHQGHAFLGSYIAPAPEFSFGFRGRMDERPDSSRSVYDGRFAYIRHFMPHLPHCQDLHYQLETPTTRVWRDLFRRGKLNEVQSHFWRPKAPEELYDLTADPHETKNLAHDPKHRPALERFRSALAEHMAATRDTGIFPEGMMHDRASELGVLPAELIGTLKEFPFAELREARNLALDPEASVETVRNYLTSRRDASIRYWTALYCLDRGRGLVRKLETELVGLLGDPSRSVQVAAAEALGIHSQDAATRQRAIRTLMANANPEAVEAYHAVAALNALDHLPELPGHVKEEIRSLPHKAKNTPGRANGYVSRMLRHILESPRAR